MGCGGSIATSPVRNDDTPATPAAAAPAGVTSSQQSVGVATTTSIEVKTPSSHGSNGNGKLASKPSSTATGRGAIIMKQPLNNSSTLPGSTLTPINVTALVHDSKGSHTNTVSPGGTVTLTSPHHDGDDDGNDTPNTRAWKLSSRRNKAQAATHGEFFRGVDAALQSKKKLVTMTSNDECVVSPPPVTTTLQQRQHQHEHHHHDSHASSTSSPSSSMSGLSTTSHIGADGHVKTRTRLPTGESVVIDEEDDICEFKEFHEGGDQLRAVAYLDSLLTFTSIPTKNGLTLVPAVSSASSSSVASVGVTSNNNGGHHGVNGTESLKSYRSRVVLAPISDTSSTRTPSFGGGNTSGTASINGSRPLTISMTTAASSSSSSASLTGASSTTATAATATATASGAGTTKAASLVIAGTASIKAKQKRLTAAGGGGGGTSSTNTTSTSSSSSSLPGSSPVMNKSSSSPPTSNGKERFRSARARASASNFRAFYQKQFARQVKSSVMASGMLRSFQDMFASMDTDNKGYINFDAFEKLLIRLGLPDSNARTLAAILGMSRDQSLRYDEFEKLLSLGLHSSYLRLARVQQDRVDQVFLGGSCNPTTWRRDEAIPYLDQHSIRYYNPQVADWNAELVILEALAKTHAEVCLFVIDDQTRAIASMIEAAEFIAGEREVVVVIKDIQNDTSINNERVGNNERRDLNRARAYLADIAQRHLPHGVFRSVSDACAHVVVIMNQKKEQREREAKRIAAHHLMSGSGSHSGPSSPTSLAPNLAPHSHSSSGTAAAAAAVAAASSPTHGHHHHHNGSGGNAPHHHHAHTIALTTAPSYAPGAQPPPPPLFTGMSSANNQRDSPRSNGGNNTPKRHPMASPPSSSSFTPERRPGSSHGGSLDGSLDGIPTATTTAATTGTGTVATSSPTHSTGSIRGGRLPPLLPPPVDGHRRRPSSNGNGNGNGSIGGSVGRSLTTNDASLTASQRHRNSTNGSTGGSTGGGVADWEAEVTNSLRATLADEANGRPSTSSGRPGSSGGATNNNNNSSNDNNMVTSVTTVDGGVSRGESMEIIISPAKRVAAATSTSSSSMMTARSNTVAIATGTRERSGSTSGSGSGSAVTGLTSSGKPMHLEVKAEGGRDSPQQREIDAMSDILFPGRLPHGNRRARSSSSASGVKKKITDESYFGGNNSNGNGNGTSPLMTPSSPPLSPLPPGSPGDMRPESTDGKSRSEFYYDRVMGEMMPSFKDLFDQMDVDKRGHISPKEIQAMLSKLQLTEGSLDSLMIVIGVRADQSVDFPQFCRLMARALHLKSVRFSNLWEQDKRVTAAQVFLGGSCNPTTWRQDIAIPILQRASITYYNPQVDNWLPELVLIEALVKSNCDILLFVIDPATRAIGSMIEAVENIIAARHVVLVVNDIPPAASIGGEAIGPLQTKDLNRSRSYLIDVAQRHGVSVFRDIAAGVQHIVDRVAKRDTVSAARVRLPGGSAPSSPIPGAKLPPPSSLLTNSNGGGGGGSPNGSNHALKLSPPANHNTAVRSHTVPLAHETFSDQVEAFVTSDEFMDKCRREFASTQVDPELDSIDRMGLLQALQKIHREVQTLLPPGTTMKKPVESDVDRVITQFGLEGSHVLYFPQFLAFSKDLFRNVCKMVKAPT